ncbi:hypothetical protein QFC22_000668 [Naganishia vaughanmartiniae]|uniref:Uncharacterized protein n=1 Tax=Naganishia vaughanmartiniae TaxID=1424756 RepID=A0ACC2XIL1_9TREE|nr:hypothetical protein QFC22_000668 [Naganishia vaughanmartiniae]
MAASRTPSKTSGSRHNTPSKQVASAFASNSHANITLDGFDTSFAKGDTSFITRKPTGSTNVSPRKSAHTVGRITAPVSSSNGLNANLRGFDTDRKDTAHSSSNSGKFATGRNLDRFIPSRKTSGDLSIPSLANSSLNISMSDLSLGDTSTLSNHDGSSQSHTRILSFAAAPPPPASHNPHANSHLNQSRQYTGGTRGGHAGGSRSAQSTGQPAVPNKRRIPAIPDRVLDAPGFKDDYYLNLVSWSSSNKVAIGLGELAYVWNADTGDVTCLGTEGDDQPQVCSVDWASDGSFLAIGNEDGAVELWDADTGQRVRKMEGHQARVAALSWNGSVVSSGCKDGSIHHHDVRVAQHKVQDLRGHRAEVCGLAWRGDGQFLASGGNDNVVNCWDGRIGQSVLKDAEGLPTAPPKWQKMNHTAAVKAIAWCPWQTSLLATGGGTSDQTIHFWSSTTGARLSSLPTSSQVTSLIWSNHSKEILATHGFPDKSMTLWSYPSLTKVQELQGAHDERILGSAVSPDGCTVVTGAADENLKFWKIWEARNSYKSKSEDRDENGAVRTKHTPSMWR